MDDKDKRLRLKALCGGVLIPCCGLPLTLPDDLARSKGAVEVAAVLSASGPCGRGVDVGLAPAPLVSSMTTKSCVPLPPNAPRVEPAVRSCGRTNCAPAVMGATTTFGDADDADGETTEAMGAVLVGDSRLRDEPAPPREPARGSGGLSFFGELNRDVGDATGTSTRVGANKSRLRCADNSWSELARRTGRRGGV